ncbi:Uncharacterised protein [BD1-7 clade bacterium]|nr:Uncharacterised protein [BD1-7 clade bacterium]CAA0083542.1 Uncharacterised protein [BD1-7 clade bacterium]
MESVIKIAILINFVLLVISLFSSLIFVYKEKGKGNRTFYALCIRAGLALSLILLVALALAMGIIAPHAPWDTWQ